MAILSAVWMARGKPAGFIGAGLFLLGAVGVVCFAPWRHPSTPYWKLMLPLYLVFACSVVWALWTWPEGQGARWALLFGLLPCFIPLFTAGRNRWNHPA